MNFGGNIVKGTVPTSDKFPTPDITLTPRIAALRVKLAKENALPKKQQIEFPNVGTCHQKGKQAEIEFAAILKSLGFSVVLASHPSPFDIGCNGSRIEVKYASLCYSTKGSTHCHWEFNIHRHGKLDESRVDVYALICGGNRNIRCQYILIIPAPLARKTYIVSQRSLRRKHAQYLNRWELIARSARGIS